MMNICIGIVSYFPDGEVRQNRINKFNEVLDKIYAIFDLPIIIVAQNWKDTELNIDSQSSEIYLYKYDNALGITGARKKLRKIFLQSNFDYLIMLDDDSILKGARSEGNLYIEQLKANPNRWGSYKDSLLKLFAISKYMYSLVDFPDGEAVNGDYFEDMYLVKACRKLYWDKEFKFRRTGLNEISDSAKDKNSTWFHGQYDKHQMGDRTRAMIDKLC